MPSSDDHTPRPFMRTAPAVKIGDDPALEDTTAIIAWHGMGQQLPFQTVEAVARALAKREGRQPGRAVPQVTAQIVQLGEQKLWRAALDLQDEEGRRHRVHVYEAYWAHCTQGKITVAEAMKFLVAAAYQGVRYALWPPRILRRFLFDRWVAFRLSSGLALLYLLALVSLVSLILVNFAVTTAASVKLLTGPGDTTSWPSYALLRDLTVDLAGLALVFGASFVVFYAAYRRQQVARRDVTISERRPLLRMAIWSLVALSVLMTLVVGLMVAYHLFVHTNLGGSYPAWPAPLSQWVSQWSIDAWADSPWMFALAALTWLAVLVGTMAVRWFLLEFVGDAAIYVSSHKMNRFYETRQAIKEGSAAVAKAVYEFGRSRRHILLGHSLGSVIAYDTLNRLIVDDTIAGGGLKVVERTSSLVTYGSILDKTAFLFRVQSDFSDVREALASVGQPLISDPSARPRWVNIHSRDDVLSGPLDYYDLPPASAPAPQARLPTGHPKPIDNLEDPYAWIPLLGHEQYLSNELLLSTLANTITGGPSSVPPPRHG